MNTSARIKQFLEINDSATVEQLSRVLDLTKADIHYHIRLLLKHGEIDTLQESYQSGSGRPARQFRLNKPAPESLSRLIISLLTTNFPGYLDKTTHKNDPASLLANGILEHSCDNIDRRVSPSIRLNKIINRLSFYGIHLRWQAGKTGPMIKVEQEFLSSLIKDKILVNKTLEILLVGINEKIA